MYIEEIKIKNLRVFGEASATFHYQGREQKVGDRTLSHSNVNLILGNNGSGKSSLLKAIAMVAVGPLATKFSPYMLVRNRKEKKRTSSAQLDSVFRLNWQDEIPIRKPYMLRNRVKSSVEVVRHGDEEFIRTDNSLGSGAASVRDLDFTRMGSDRRIWDGMYKKSSPAFFCVGYGATRRVDTDPNAATPDQKLRNLSFRLQRTQSLFSDGYPLTWLGHWLPVLKKQNPGRYKQVCERINDVLPPEIEFTKITDGSGEFLFSQHGALVPFAALSDGCRAFVGWVADMLYHLCFGCPSGVKLVDNCGIVLVDEIDLHLHPEWQRTVLPKLAITFPNLQFIVTSHSPIVVGTLQRENIWVCEPSPDGEGSVLVQKPTGVNGLNADQILNTEYFGLESSRSLVKTARLKQIAAAAERKMPGQARAFLKSLITSIEDEVEPLTEGSTKKAMRKPSSRKNK